MAISLPDTSLPKKGPGSLPTAASDLDIQRTHQHHSLASNSEDDLSISEATFVSEAIDSLSIRKQQIVDGIVGLYVEQIDDWTARLASYVKGATGTIETGHGSHKSQDLSYVPAGSTSCPSQKRKRQEGDGRDEDREDDDSDSRGKKPKPDNDTKDGNCAPLACPYYKFDRWPCELRSCKGPGWPTVVRVKEHVYRCHSVPKYICIRCQRDLKTAAMLQDHAQEAQSCEQQTPRFTYQVGQVLESNLRNRQGLNKLDRLEKWRKVYKMIFDVEDSHIPDPRMGFGDKSTPESLGDFLRRGMPGQIRRLATAEVDRLFVPQAEACQADEVSGLHEQTSDNTRPVYRDHFWCTPRGCSHQFAIFTVTGAVRVLAAVFRSREYTHELGRPGFCDLTSTGPAERRTKEDEKFYLIELTSAPNPMGWAIL
ncbi:hypothetical protein BN1708_000504 [Verticillium longisporum]|uniref:C2H2-type domain-containing protein n=1 Tax=Verticillium longisporum TaxID=100787 RepID=A0A0G4LD88_VERLO|nr:hypothetical protein BN1708_000504 [Verticillium longisporum]